MNFYKSRYTGAQIDSLLDKVKEDLVSPATLTNKVEANTAAIEQEVTDREKAVSDLNSALTAELDKKVSKVPGKGLSTNDYTNDDKAEVTKIKDKADQTDLNETNSNIRDINTAIEKLVPKEDINTGTFDPTSDNPASQKSIYTALMESINDKADKVNTYTKAETDTAIQTAINIAILTALNTAV